MLISSVLRFFIPFLLIKDTIQSSDLVPGVATSYNLPVILEAMRCNSVERAQVAGWDCFRGDYVVYQNGAVVPGIKGDLPEVAIYFKECEKGKGKIVFVNKRNPKCPIYKKEVIYPSNESKPCHPPLVIERPPLVVNHNPVVVKPCPPVVVEHPPVVKPCPPAVKPCCPVGDKSFTRNSKKVRCGKNCKAEELKSSSMSFVYTTDRINGQNARVLIVNEKNKKETKTKIFLDRDSNLRIKILNHPEKLICIKLKAEKILCGKVCLYVNDLSNVYVLFKDRLYSMNNREITPKLVSKKARKELIRRGLYSVEFRN